MAGTTRNFHLVPVGDRPYFLRATVVGLRAQLEGLGLNSSGLKVDLYLRLTNGGHRLYTDDRDQSDSDQSDGDQSDGDQSDGDQSNSEQPDDDQSGSDQSDDDQPGDDQPGDNDGDDGQGGSPPGGAGHKRQRDDGDNNNNDNQGSLQPPPRKTLRVDNDIPAELRLQIMGYLNLAQLWNLAMAVPAGYLSDDINVFVMDAHRQHAIDYPPSNNDDQPGDDQPGDDQPGDNDGDDGGSGSGGSGSGSAGNPSSSDSDGYDYGDEPNRPLSMLEWVGRRLIYDPSFGTAWRARILQLIDTYLQVYGQADNGPEDQNVIEDILYYFRPNPPYGTPFPLLRAARDHRPDVVHLLLLRGEPVDQTIPGSTSTALSRAVDGGLSATSYDSDGMHTIFALIGAGADVTLATEGARDAAADMLEETMELPEPGEEDWHTWQRIVNVRGLSVREFIADPRSDYFDRGKLAMYVIAFSSPDVDLDYPGLE